MQGTWILSLAGKIPHAAKQLGLLLKSAVLLLKPTHSRAHELQLLSLHALEPVLCNKRIHHNQKPAHHNDG